ncbi:hypothetical protein CB1_000880018 [Camelus ferus]|nr:hypothetical protein CB1_000880018 [Camelus ferus]
MERSTGLALSVQPQRLQRQHQQRLPSLEDEPFYGLSALLSSERFHRTPQGMRSDCGLGPPAFLQCRACSETHLQVVFPQGSGSRSPETTCAAPPPSRTHRTLHVRNARSLARAEVGTPREAIAMAMPGPSRLLPTSPGSRSAGGDSCCYHGRERGRSAVSSRFLPRGGAAATPGARVSRAAGLSAPTCEAVGAGLFPRRPFPASPWAVGPDETLRDGVGGCLGFSRCQTREVRAGAPCQADGSSQAHSRPAPVPPSARLCP